MKRIFDAVRSSGEPRLKLAHVVAFGACLVVIRETRERKNP
jgi:hypothetical protein